MKKVIHFLTSDIYSGAENVACQIIHSFENEFDMYYVSPPGPIKTIVQSKGIKYIPIEEISVRGFKQIIKKYKPDVIHAHDIRASVFASLVSGDIPVISHVHCKFTDMSRLSLKSLLYRISIPKYKNIIAVSNSALDEYYFRKALSKKCTVLYNVVDKNELYQRVQQDPNQYDFDIVFIGRLAEQKNPLRLLEVFKMVAEQNPDLKFGIVGDGAIRDEMEALVQKSSLTDKVTFMGFMDNPSKLLSQAKVMLMTSHFEGTPMAALEAMLLAVPLVSTPVDGLKDIVKNDFNGYTSNDNKELSEHLLSICSDHEKWKGLSTNALEYALDYNNMDHYKNKISEIYESCLDR
ncbi:glycosyltransferase [Bacillus sp. ISL-7]|uniref:glycosyltransferase n=1 Tax=Bacillus sp. ISL-7 TaxID=2819136 RepID=UPI001BEB4682|nr:glycosyltransferase [Bacillus sp. ISL-7]MBT2738385.1 glycosyltransferase [Bacillus sp. ISL-7]